MNTTELKALNKIVLFDGVCNFCESSVQFIIKHDVSNSLLFASLQSPLGQQLLDYYKMPKNLEGVVFIDNQKTYFGFWKSLLVFSILPIFLTDFVYDTIARNRYKWFGKKESCMLPTPELRKKFLDL